MPESNSLHKTAKKQYYQAQNAYYDAKAEVPEKDESDEESLNDVNKEKASGDVKPVAGVYGDGYQAETAETSPATAITSKARSKVWGHLKEALDITGPDQQRYRIYPLLTEEQARLVEQQTGIILKQEEGKTSGFLGGGAFGEFYVGERVNVSEANRFVGIKVMTKRLEESAEEANIQQALTQATPTASHLMPLHAAIAERNAKGDLTRLYYVMPLAALGNGANLRTQLNSLDNAELRRLVSWHIAQGLLLGLWQMHQSNTYHLDVKLDNLVVNLNGWVSIIDFGCAVTILPTAKSPGQALLTTHKDSHTGRYIGNGDPHYFAPERPDEEEETFDCMASDLYSAGLALWELWTGEKVKDYRKDHPGHAFLEHPRLQNVPTNSLGDLVKRLIQPVPKQRWNLLQALNHPIFQAPDLHDQETMQVVLDFLKRFVQQVQLKARDESMEVSLNALAPSSAVSDTTTLVDTTVKRLQDPFANRPDIKEQLSLYLPLQGALVREVKTPEKECFALAAKTEEFLQSADTALVLLADGGSGKSLFTHALITQLLNRGNDSRHEKPWLPLYIALGGIQHPENLLQEGLGLSHEALTPLQANYRLLLIADGYDEQAHWINLYVQNQLHRYDLKILITCRINALPPVYSQYFVPHVPGESRSRGYQEIYVQPFNAQQIEAYIHNYVGHQQERLQAEVANQQLGKEWLEVGTYQNQIDNTSGLKELIQTPLLCRLVLEALPELAKTQANNMQLLFHKITRAQVYEAFMTRWIEQQRHKHPQPPTQEQILKLGQRTALSLYQANRAVQINTGIAQFQFDEKKGQYQQQLQAFDWFIQAKLERECLPLQEVQKGQYKFMHFSMQEFLLARHLYQQLKQARSLQDLDWNQLPLTREDKDLPLLSFLGDFASMDEPFGRALLQVIDQTKRDKTQARAGANAISVLNAAHYSFSELDLSGISIPGANLNIALLDSTNLSHADLANVSLRRAWLRNANLSGANLTGVQFGQQPQFKCRNKVVSIALSAGGAWLVVGLVEGGIEVWDWKQGTLCHMLTGHTDRVSSVAIGEGKIVSGSDDKTVRVWDLATGKPLGEPLKGHTDDILSVAIGGGKIVSGSDDKTIRVWDLATGKPLGEPLKGPSSVRSVTVVEDKIFSRDYRGILRVWDLTTLKLLGEPLKSRTERYTSMAVGEGIIVTGCDDNTVRVWDLKTFQCLNVLTLDKLVEAVCFKDSTWVIASGDRIQRWRYNQAHQQFILQRSCPDRWLLWLDGCQVEGVKGLTPKQIRLMAQLSAKGTPLSQNAKQTANALFPQEETESSYSQTNIKELEQQAGNTLPMPDNNTVSSVNNNNSTSAFPKAPPTATPPKSLLFTPASNLLPITALQRWIQTQAAKGGWYLEREGKNLRIQFEFNAMQKNPLLTLILTPLREHLSKLPADWQQKVATYQQEGQALTIRCRSEADAKDCEAPLKAVLGIEEFKLNESCVMS